MALREAVEREVRPGLRPNSPPPRAEMGTCTLFEHARLANRFPPVLHNFDARGERIELR